MTLWEFYVRPDVAPASIEKMAYPLPDKPSIAVLPFDNMSKDPEQDYFSDGMTEEIITALSQVPDMFVIARNSTFTYKGTSVKVHQVAEELGVRYVLEGSVRKSGDRIRVTAQLIDAITGKHVWAERYDKPLKDIFAIQDEITFKVLAALHLKISGNKIAHKCARGTDNVDAYLKFLQAYRHFFLATAEDNFMARKLFMEAVALDPDYSSGYAMIALTHITDIAWGSSKSPKLSLAEAFKLSQQALSLDITCVAPYLASSYYYLFTRQHAKAIATIKQGVTVNPNTPGTHGLLANHLVYAGKAEEAIEPIETALRIDPKPPLHIRVYQGTVYLQNGMHKEAILALKKALDVAPNAIPIHLRLAVCYSLLGREDEARAEIAQVRKLSPKLSLAYISKTQPYKNQADLDLIISALRKAGLK